MLSSPRLGVSVEKVNPKTATKNILKSKIPKTENQIKQIRLSLSKIFLFKDLNELQMSEMIDYMFKKEIINKEVIIKEGDPGDYFYVVEKGIFSVYKDKKLLKNYENNGYFGELALIYNTPRNATVTAMSEGIIWCLDGDSFRRIVLKHAYEQRTKFEDIINNIPLFKSLKDYEKMMIPDALIFKTLINKKIIIEGKKNDKIYFIENGECQIIKNIEGKEIVKKIIKNGFFGEECILFDRPSSFSVVTGENTSLGILESDTFRDITSSSINKFKTNFETFLKSLI